MAEYFEAVRLSPELVRNHVVASSGWGRILQLRADAFFAERSREGSRSEGERRETDVEEAPTIKGARAAHSAASSYLIAAGHAALFEPALAELLFWAASREYLRTGEPRLIGGVLAACTHDEELRATWAGIVRRGSPFAPREHLYALLILAAARERNESDQVLIRWLMESLSRLRGGYLTDLFVPASFFIDALEGILDLDIPGERPARATATAITALLRAYVDQLEVARTVRLSWNTLNSRFLPVSPEVLAILLLAARRNRSVVGSPEETMGNEARHPAIKMMRDIAREILEMTSPSWLMASPMDPVLEDLVELRRQSEA